MNASRLYLLGFLIILFGFGLLVIGSATNSPSSSSSSFGGVVFIGPFPIVFGSGPGSGTLTLIAVVISAAMILAFLLSFLRYRQRTSP